ncbi:hypothetical protein VTN31DRAFT_445 [Thermomyces dupontii]|uniref:uncharacterized protein n=1 Tax=Talaromyces thermophilus TaxID=28565 RepID=UPI003743B0BD
MEADNPALLLPMEDLSGNRSGRARSPPPFQIYEDDKNGDNEQDPETELQISSLVDLANDPEADKENKPPTNTSSRAALGNAETVISLAGEHNTAASIANPTHGRQLQNPVQYAETSRAVFSVNSTLDAARIASATPSSPFPSRDARFLVRSPSPCEARKGRKEGLDSDSCNKYMDDYDLEEYDVSMDELKGLLNDDA